MEVRLTCLHPCCHPIQIMWWFLWVVTIAQFVTLNWVHGRRYKENNCNHPKESSRELNWMYLFTLVFNQSIATLSDWAKIKLATLAQTIRGKTKTNSDLLVQFFPPLRVIASSFDWTMKCPASFVIGQSNFFGFDFMTLNWKLFFNSISGITHLTG